MKINDIYNQILIICNAYDRNGPKTDNTTENYKARIPSICDMGQRELIQAIKYKKSFTTTLSSVEGEGYRDVSLPTDAEQITAIIDYNGRNWLYDSTFAYQDGEFYVKNDYSGTLTVKYIPYPAIMTTLDSEFTIDDAAVNPALVYYTAAMLLIDQNSSKASFYRSKYEEERERLKRRNISSCKPVIDVYR